MDKSYRIGDIELGGPFILAPLAGITDQVMRTLCEEQGAALTCTEMVSAKGLYYGDRNTPKLTYISEDAGPTAIQIFGSEPDIMAFAADKLNGARNAILDINMGCPVPKVVKNGDGAALMRDPELIYRVVKAVVGASAKPVTVKLRKGFDDEHVNAVDAARACESAGAAGVCIHGRTREQFYDGEADWQIIANVKRAVRITVIGNGDIRSGADGVSMLERTGCDLAMIARGALGNPWIFAELARALGGDASPRSPQAHEISAMMQRHFRGLIELKGEYSAIREMRKHFAWYTKGIRGSSKLRRMVNEIDNAQDMYNILQLAE